MDFVIPIACALAGGLLTAVRHHKRTGLAVIGVAQVYSWFRTVWQFVAGRGKAPAAALPAPANNRTGDADADADESSGILAWYHFFSGWDLPLLLTILEVVLAVGLFLLGVYCRWYRRRFFARFNAKLERQKQLQYVQNCHLMEGVPETNRRELNKYVPYTLVEGYTRWGSRPNVIPAKFNGPKVELDQVPRSIRLAIGSPLGFAFCMILAVVFASLASLALIRRYVISCFGDWMGGWVYEGIKLQFLYLAWVKASEQSTFQNVASAVLSTLGGIAGERLFAYLLAKRKARMAAKKELSRPPSIVELENAHRLEGRKDRQTVQLKRALTPEIERLASVRQRNERVVVGRSKSASVPPKPLLEADEERREEAARYRKFSRSYDEFAAHEAEKAERIAGEYRREVLTGFAPSHVPSAATVQSSAAAGGSAVGNTNANKLLPPGPPRFTRTASMIWRDKPASEVRTLGAAWERATTATASTGATAPPAQRPATPPPLHIPGGPPAPGPAASAPPTHLMHRD
jgi:hypothetical protein